MNKYIAELLGTCILSLVVSLSLTSQFPVPTPVLASLCVGVFVYTIGSISGCHLNPAVTIGLLFIQKIQTSQAVKYILSQIVGVLATGYILRQLSITLGPVPQGGLNVILAEMLGVMILTFGIAVVVYGDSHVAVSGLIIGGSLFLGITLSVLLGSAGVLNPAVALVLHAFHPTYIVGEIVGAFLGFSFYKSLRVSTGVGKLRKR